MAPRFTMDSKNWQRVRAGLMSAALLKPALDRIVPQRPVATTPVERLRDQVGGQFTLSQQQIEKLAKALSEVVDDLGEQVGRQAQMTAGVIRGVDRRVWWASGIAVGFGVAGLAAFLITRRRMRAQTETTDLIEITEIIEGDFQSAGDQMRDAVNGLSRNGSTAERPTEGGIGAEAAATATRTTVAQGERLASEAPFVGNAHTRIYHEADSENLPSEENRVYFFSEEEARDSGYRPAQGE